MICGFGVNDISPIGDYKVYHSKWSGMIKRCYSKTTQKKYITYQDCQVCEEWRYFSNFLKWCLTYEEDHRINCKDFALDKDLKGDKIYSPDLCCFLPKNVNTFLTIKRQNNTSNFIGVSYQKYAKRYKAEINDFFHGKRICLGYYNNPLDAAKAYTKEKLKIAKEIDNSGLLDYDISLKGLLYIKIENLLADQL